jgi:hypothetical protein
MNNEPVAWMLLGLEDSKPKLINLQVIEHLEGTWIPLYTHPADESFDRTASHMAGEYVSYNEPVVWTVCLDCGQRVTGDSIHTCSPQLKTLTDEEILEVFVENYGDDILPNIQASGIEFAKAILRKAQEK